SWCASARGDRAPSGDYAETPVGGRVPGSGYVRLVSGEPQVVWMPGGVRTEIHLVSDDTDGAFCLLVDEPPAGWSLPPHLHRGVAETIHIVEGEFEMEVGGQRSSLVAGQTIYVPADVVHSGGK